MLSMWELVDLLEEFLHDFNHIAVVFDACEFADGVHGQHWISYVDTGDCSPFFGEWANG